MREFFRPRGGGGKKGKRLRAARGVQSFSGVSQSAGLSREVKWLWEHAGGDRLSAKSFWIGKEDTPRCNLEAFAQECAAFHCPDYVGAEFWVQIRNGENGDDGGLDFHFDKDEELMKSHDLWCHPHTSTVTYISDENVARDCDDSISKMKRKRKSDEVDSVPLWGAPLVVFDTTSYMSGENMKPLSSEPKQAWVQFPRPGRHVKFPGNLLHGVPSELNNILYKRDKNSSRATYSRTSLPVNIWTHHKPQAVKRLSRDFVNELCPKLAIDMCNNFFNEKNIECDTMCNVSLPNLRSTEDIETIDPCMLPPNFSQKNMHYLCEHVDGSTGFIPTDVVCGELEKCVRQHHLRQDIIENVHSGVHILYY